ncbi:uncharacterized protein LOC117117858 isoform X2 [Anneissia japonica]|nr:uncharacterized protein LOC117117858 isoform X2 [Anneissia japonica]XP_033118220.1 uncharacterized protein LOC117117858 isoform X2 [Anneissia japonica]
MMRTCHSAAAKVKPSVKPSSGRSFTRWSAVDTMYVTNYFNSYMHDDSENAKGSLPARMWCSAFWTSIQRFFLMSKIRFKPLKLKSSMNVRNLEIKTKIK